MATSKKGGKAADKAVKKKAAPKKVENKKPVQKKTSSAPKKTASDMQNVSKAQKKGLSNEIKGILLIAFGVFLAVTFMTNATGIIGHYIKMFCYGLFGMAAAVLFLIVILTGINIFLDKKSKNTGYKIWILFGIMLFGAVIANLISKDTEFIQGSLFENIADLYTTGMSENGGGLFGGGLCKILTLLIAPAGTWILSVAVELTLIIMLTGVSFKKIIEKITTFLHREKEDVDDEEFTEVVPETQKPKKYFDDYFDEDSKESKNKPEGKKPKRFVLEMDDEAELDNLPAEENQAEPAPFKIDSLQTGVLTGFPDEDGNIPNDNADDLDFEPPSEAKLQDKLDPMTKSALKSGVPLDEAVTTGRKMATGEIETLADEVDEEVKQHSDMPRIIQYKLPPIDLLEKPKPKEKSRAEQKQELEEKANRLLDTLRSFKVDAEIINITQGPTVTRFELQPGFGVKVSKITSLTDDIALSLASPGIRMEAPIPGKSAIGIEIPNSSPSPVPIREVLDTEKFRNFKSKTAFALGKDIGGNSVIADIATFPHVLIAGATGSGKSVCINSLITSILYKANPNEVKMIMIDPKMVELGVYNGIPHLLIPVVTDPKHAAAALNWAVTEMKNRYNLLRDNKVRNLKGFNNLMEERGESELKLPEIVIIIDELADLMLAAKNEVEDAINSLAALARAAGMYLVIATQRPSVNVITGVIKANVPSRISFAVASQIDSRTILDSPGAEKLLGRGDMLYNPKGEIKPMRIQGNFVSDREIEDIISFIKSQYEAEYDEKVIEHIEKEKEQLSADLDGDEKDTGMMRSGNGERDELFLQAVEMVLESGQASVAMFQRRFKVGYQRAARLIDQMEDAKIIGPYEGTKPRQVLITRQEFNEMLINQG